MFTANADPVRRVFLGTEANRLVADVWGAGRPVLLLHGGGQTRHSWADTARALATAGYQAIAVDLRGHGDSDWSTSGSYDAPDQAGDIVAIATSLPAKPVIVGASMGGAAALLALGSRTDGGTGIASCLVLVDVTPRMENRGLRRVVEFMGAAPDGFATLDEAADSVATYRGDGRRSTGKEGLLKNLRLGSDGRYRWHWDPRLLEGIPEAELRHQRLVDAAVGIRIPVLLVRGRASDIVSLESVQELSRLIPTAEVTEVADAGHMVVGDNNDTFGAAITEFMRRA